jgi:plastocyanin
VRRLLLLPAFAVVLLVLALAAGAATTKTVSITGGGFSPRSVSIVTGDTVVWHNSDSHDHQVVATSGAFASPVLRPGKSYSFTFTGAGRFDYRDALYPSRTGVVKVAGPPPAVSLAVSLPQVDYGQAVTLSGQVNDRRPGEQVTLTAQPFGQPSPLVLATVVSGADGTFSFVTKPQILTVYRAIWKTARSIDITTAVAPVITFGRAGAFVTRVWAGRSMAAKAVQVQRLSAFGQWVTIKRVVLGELSRARFRLKLPKGVSHLRVAMSVNQAGVGYLGAFSKTIRVRVR